MYADVKNLEELYMSERAMQNNRGKPRRKIIDARKGNFLQSFIAHFALSIISDLIVGLIMIQISDFMVHKNNLLGLLFDVRMQFVPGPTLQVSGINIYKILQIEQRLAFIGHKSAARDAGRIRSLMEEAINETDFEQIKRYDFYAQLY
jgi:hypothetical protein